jgi:dienelactone hydrolase
VCLWEEDPPETATDILDFPRRGCKPLRLFEVAIVCLLLCCLMASWPSWRLAVPGRPVFAGWACFGLLALALIAHLALEGAHWQMAPAYLSILLIAQRMLSLRLSRGRWGMVSAISVVVLVVLTCGFSILLPVFSLSAPTGQYAIGTRILTLTDFSRKEDAEPGGRHFRELVVQIWYPALPSSNPRAPYRRRSETSLVSSYQSVDWTHARYDALVADEPGGFPILLYNPGWNGRRTQDTALNEELASHGYVVVATDHPYNSGPVALADGRVIRPVPITAIDDNVTSEDALYALINREVEKETTDALFVLAQVERMNGEPANAFYRHLDLSKVGAFGFSLGGMVATEVAYRNPGIGAAIAMDTPLYGEARLHGIKQPYMLLCEEITHSTPAELARMSFGERRNTEMDEQDFDRQLPLFAKTGNYRIELRGSVHSSFLDIGLTSPLKSISEAGAIPARRMIEILRAYTVAFFDQSLRGVPSPLLAAKSSPFPEAVVTSAVNNSGEKSP